ncbi:MAG: cytochrome c oxidase assembly protein [Pseudobacteriovorax sp.]|nr:cytochrome c oxidase assembly protein [Pseudobacteriovorax sp.]
MSVAYAHGAFEELPDNLFEVKWDWDPALVFFVLLLLFYFRALPRFKKQPVKPWQIWMFVTGIALNILALSPPIDPYADRLFWVHMVQHLMITHLGVPLMLFGVPFFVVIRGVPLWFRRYIYFPYLRSWLNRFVSAVFFNPIVALVLFEVNYWFWHVPRFYNLALFNDYYHLLEHACFAITAMLLWRNIIDPAPMKSRLKLPVRILYLGFIMALNVILSAFLTFADEVLYGYEGMPVPEFWQRWGYLHDQRLGGLIMWVPGGLIMLIAMTAVFFVWANKEEKKDQLALEMQMKPV